MKKSVWNVYAAWILFTEAAGALSGWLTREGAQTYVQTVKKPPFSPPAAVFPIVWSILFLLMGIGAARIYLAAPSDSRTKSLRIFLIQLIFNFFWSIIFFNQQKFGAAFLWLLVLWGLIFWMILSYRKTDAAAAWMQVPYFLWVTFAAYLNLGVWVLNR